MSSINWRELNNVDQLDELKKLSFEQTVVLFKHSTRCPISAMALNRLERSWNGKEQEETAIFFLDLIRYRDVSNAVAERFGVFHQSPQVIILRNGEAVYDESHMGISYDEINSQVNA